MAHLELLGVQRPGDAGHDLESVPEPRLQLGVGPWRPRAGEAPHPDFDYGQFYVVTDVNAGGSTDASSVQEFIAFDPTITESAVPLTATPEPATMLLVGGGLLGLGAFRSRRRSA